MMHFKCKTLVRNIVIAIIPDFESGRDLSYWLVHFSRHIKKYRLIIFNEINEYTRKTLIIIKKKSNEIAKQYDNTMGIVLVKLI